MLRCRFAIQSLSLANWLVLCASLLHSQELATGKLLVASRGLRDPNFAEAVVLLTNYSEKGSMGLILNRPSDVPLTRAWPEAKTTKPLFFGGPVEVFRVLALQQAKNKPEAGNLVVQEVYFLSARNALEKALKDAPNSVRVFAGYAGWGPRQLDNELKLGGWHLLQGTAKIAFDPSPETLWERMIRKTEVISVHLLLPTSSIY